MGRQQDARDGEQHKHRDLYHDPSGAGAAAFASSRQHRGLPVFDWVDALLIVGGVLLLVGVIQGLVALVPSLADQVVNMTRALATVFAFGPILVRRAKFAHTINRDGEIRDGLLFRFMSVIGLLLVPVGAFFLVASTSFNMRQGDNPSELSIDEDARMAFTAELLAQQPAEPTMLEALAYAEQEMSETGRNDGSPEGQQRRQQWLDQARRQSAEIVWQSEVENRIHLSETQERMEARYLRYGVFGILALAAAVFMMRARYKPPEGQRV